MAFVFLGLIFDLLQWHTVECPRRLVAWISARAASLIRGTDQVHRWIDRAIGTLFIYVGIRLAIIQRG
jgi:threonine/homoserine/homoserine lactone efflux protein